jgi:uncharacterized repeat protein (TIGR01451 family)
MADEAVRKHRPPSRRLIRWLRFWLPAVALGAACLLLATPAAAATIVVNNLNDPGEGFNDPTPADPVAGNPETTLGAQRLAAFQAAADEWGAMLVSPVTIMVDAEMDPSMSCTQNSATLGSAGPNGFIASDFDGAPFANTWYPQAMVNAITGEDIDPARSDVFAQFNPDIGTPGCLEALGWSYVIGAPAPAGTIPFTETVLHEIGHGLGFLTFITLFNGAYCCPGSQKPDHYSRFLLDETPAPTLWTALTNNGRKNSAIDDGNLTWAGARVADVAGLLSAGRHASGRVQMYAPSPLEQGSSVSHWDTELTPNDIMEPFLQSNNEQRLTNHLMLDIGWRAQLALAVTKTDGRTSISAGSPTAYTITLTNNGPADITVVGATVTDTMPAALSGVTWICGGAGGASCASANGAGNINTTVTVPRNGVITFTVSATVSALFTGTLSNTVTVGMTGNLQNTVSSSATDQTTVTGGAPTPGITVSAISGNTTEAGGTATFTAVLDSQPTANVTIALSSSDTTEGTVAPSQFVFTAANWATPQQATVTGVDDAVDDGNIAYSIVTAPAVSADGNYNNLNAANVAVTNLDDDTAGIAVSAISGNTTEAGGTATFTIVLDTQPTANVTIGLSSSDTTEGTVAPSQFVFTAANWATPQQATVTGVDDDVEDGNIAYSIVTAAAVSGDANYSGRNAANVAVINLDDDADDLIFADGFE